MININLICVWYLLKKINLVLIKKIFDKNKDIIINYMFYWFFRYSYNVNSDENKM